MEKIAAAITNAIRKENLSLTELQYKTIEFGLECLLSELSKFIIYFIIFSILSLTTNFWVATAFICIPRLFAGGYHSDTYWGCFFVTLAALGMAVLGGKYFILNVYIKLAFFILSLLLVIYYAPVDHPNKPIISQKRRNKLKFLSIIAFIAFGATAVAIPHTLSSTGMIALFIEAVFLPIGYYLNRREEGNVDVKR